jgi:hypothetical protein
MVAALGAALGRPDWWSMALAGFLVRGGIVLVLLPIVTIPSPAALATLLSPTINQLAFGGLTTGVLLAILVAIGLVLALIAAVGLGGAWLDRELLRETAAEDELDLGWIPLESSLREALSLRLTAHLPTLAALAYATFRLIGAAYDELLSPGDDATPIGLRVIERAPEAVVVLVAFWLLGEALGGLAARRAAAGATYGSALRDGLRQLLSGRGIATLVLTSIALVAVVVPFLLAVTRAWGDVRDVLIAPPQALPVGAALLVLVASWILGLAVTGAVLAWRAAAWTALLAPRPGGSAGGDATTSVAVAAVDV